MSRKISFSGRSPILSWDDYFSTFKVPNDIFLFYRKCELANYTDDNTMYLSDKNIDNIMTSLNQDFSILSKWLFKN